MFMSSSTLHLNQKKSQTPSVGQLFSRPDNGQKYQGKGVYIKPSESTSLDPSVQDLRQKMNQPHPTEAETKWFGNYNGDSAYQTASSPSTEIRPSKFPTSFKARHFYGTPPSFTPVQQPLTQAYQTPLNLTKGMLETWANVPLNHQVYQSHCFPIMQQEEEETVYSMPSLASSLFGVIGFFFGDSPESGGSISNTRVSTSSATSSTPISVVHSKLNPNAKEFKPSLNPNAKEFSPLKPVTSSATPETKSVESGIEPTEQLKHSETTSDDIKSDISDAPTPCLVSCITPTLPKEMEVQLKSAAERLCTPWLAGGEPSCPRDESLPEETEEEDMILGEVVEDDNDDEDLDSDDDEEEDDEHPGASYRCGRQRSLSSCSDESFIEFTASSPTDSPTVLRTCDTKKRPSNPNSDSGHKKFALAVADDDSDDESDSSTNTYNDEDDDWDEVDRSHVLDDEEFREQMSSFGFDCPLLVSSFGGDESKKRLTINDSDKKFVVVEDGLPGKDRLSAEETEERVREANRVWQENCKRDPQMASQTSPSRKQTTFAPREMWSEIYEEPEMADDLRASRISDVAQRRADHERMERLIAPILQSVHREKVWRKLFGDN